ncbi:MAG: hypothetical protein P4L36_22735 [Holophaga sp.]|nr:hypothetical protein [Holophaga sp.]
MNFAKDRKVLIGGLILFGLALLVYGSVHLRRQDPDALPGPRPGTLMMSLAVGQAIEKRLGGPEALESQDVYAPAVDHVGSQACWRFPIVYRVRAAVGGGVVLHHGAVWVKDGHVLRMDWE